MRPKKSSAGSARNPFLRLNRDHASRSTVSTSNPSPRTVAPVDHTGRYDRPCYPVTSTVSRRLFFSLTFFQFLCRLLFPCSFLLLSHNSPVLSTLCVLKPNFLCSLGSSKSLSAPRVGLPFVYHRFDLHPMTKYNNRYNPTALVIHPLPPAVVCFSPTPLVYPIGGPLGFVPGKMQTNHAGPVTSANFEIHHDMTNTRGTLPHSAGPR